MRRRPPPGLLGYTVNSPLWSDGATKDRWLYVPEGTKIGVLPDGDFDIPPGSTAVKTFTVGGKKVETRLFVRYADASWAGYSYEWNDEQTDATLLGGGKTKPLASGGSWTFPSRAECFACHTSVAGFTLGLEARQLDRDEGGTNQLARFAAVLDRPVLPNALAPAPRGRHCRCIRRGARPRLPARQLRDVPSRGLRGRGRDDRSPHRQAVQRDEDLQRRATRW